jgi:hypothetical protein
MSDFDDILERLLVDPAFRARLASDPQSALAGYRLTPEEVGILESQVTGDTGAQHRVEQRTSKASLFGLLSPLAGMGTSLGEAASSAGGGRAEDVAHGLGTPGQRSPQELVQAAFDQAQAGIDAAQQRIDAARGFGDALHSPDISTGERHGGIIGNLFDDGVPGGAGDQSQSGIGAPPVGAVEPAVVPVGDYHTRVDVQGDGKWDDHMYVGRADGGVDIVVDLDKDGRADFIGRDFDRDGLIDESVMDTNRDGVMDTQYVDVNGDGWLDKRVPYDPNGPGQAGSHIGRHRAAEGGH